MFHEKWHDDEDTLAKQHGVQDWSNHQHVFDATLSKVSNLFSYVY